MAKTPVLSQRPHPTELRRCRCGAVEINGRLHDALSAFDSRKEAIINLKVDVKKED
jgi:hypothetical protein